MFTDSLDNVSDYVSTLSTFEDPLAGLKTSTTGEPGAPPAAKLRQQPWDAIPKTWRFIMNQKPMKAVSNAILWLLVLSKLLPKKTPLSIILLTETCLQKRSLQGSQWPSPNDQTLSNCHT